MKRKPEENFGRIGAVADVFARKERFLIMTHVHPDGDGLGSLLALGQGLERLGKTVCMFSPGGVPPLYRFLPGADQVAADPGAPEAYEVAVLLDGHDLTRIGDQAARISRVPLLYVLDHHLTGGDRIPGPALVDSRAAATGVLVYQLLVCLGVDLTPAMATNLYVALATDTGFFGYENTSPASLEIAAELVRQGARPWEIFQELELNRPPERLELLRLALESLEYHHQGRLAALSVTPAMMTASKTTPRDSEGLVDFPRAVRGVELAVLFQESEDGVCQVSLRSRGRVNAAALAGRFGGGGHHNAAGFSLAGPLAEVKERLITAAGAFLGTDRPGGGA